MDNEFRKGFLFTKILNHLIIKYSECISWSWENQKLSVWNYGCKLYNFPLISFICFIFCNYLFSAVPLHYFTLPHGTRQPDFGAARSSLMNLSRVGTTFHIRPVCRFGMRQVQGHAATTLLDTFATCRPSTYSTLQAGSTTCYLVAAVSLKLCAFNVYCLAGHTEMSVCQTRQVPWPNMPAMMTLLTMIIMMLHCTGGCHFEPAM